MADYKTIHGTTVKSYTTDPDNPIEGQVWYDKTNNVLQYQHPNVTTAGAWRTGGNLNDGKMYLAGAGTQTAGIAFGGGDPSPSQRFAQTELYNGSSWTEVSDLGTARSGLAGASAGTQTASLAIGGETPSSAVAVTESWNGSSWTEVADINTARHLLKGAGTQPAALVFGGSPARAVT